MPTTGERRGHLIYHWKHGWIPLDHFAALSKAKGSHKGAEKIMERHGIPQVGEKGAGKSRYSDMTLSDLIQRRNAGDRSAGDALKRGDYRTTVPTPAPAPKPVSDRPGAPGAMNKAAYEDYSAKVGARRRELQSTADSEAKALPETQARGLLARHEEIRTRLSIGLGQYDSRPYPSEQDIEALARADANARALRDRVAYFDNRRRAAAGKLPATESQVAFIHRLRAQRKRTGEGGGFMSFAGDPAKLTKAEASALIDSLRGTY